MNWRRLLPRWWGRAGALAVAVALLAGAAAAVDLEEDEGVEVSSGGPVASLPDVELGELEPESSDAEVASPAASTVPPVPAPAPRRTVVTLGSATTIPNVTVTTPRVTVPVDTVPVVTVPPSSAAPTLAPTPAERHCAEAREGASPPPTTGLLTVRGVYTAAADGTDVRHVVRSDDAGTWNGARTRLAYRVDLDNPYAALCVLEGETVRQLAKFMPSGSYTASGAAQSWTAEDSAAVVDLSGRVPLLLSFDGRTGARGTEFRDAYLYDVSPDGRRVAFVAGRHPAQELRVGDVATGQVRTVKVLDQERYSVSAPRWLPDGSGVAYRSDGLYVVDVATGARRTLVTGDGFGGGVYSYAFASDGRLAYSSYSGGQDEGRLFVAAPDGSGARTIATGPFTWMTWSPDGQRILAATGRDADSALVVMAADGTSTKTLFRARGTSGQRALRFVINTGWSRDSSRIEFGLVPDLIPLP